MVRIDRAGKAALVALLCAGFLLTGCKPHQQKVGKEAPLPTVVEKDGRFALLVDGAPFLILGVLFWFQHKGTKAIGGVFGPVMLVWFLTIGGLGAWHIWQYPQILAALNPAFGFALLRHHPAHAVGLLGAVILAITGAEALYADLGHFGRKHIAAAWYWIVFPGLTLNYFGQGAYVLSHPAGSENPFFALAPAGSPRLALVALSIAGTVMGKLAQILYSGAFWMGGTDPNTHVVYTGVINDIFKTIVIPAAKPNAFSTGSYPWLYVEAAKYFGVIQICALFGLCGVLLGEIYNLIRAAIDGAMRSSYSASISSSFGR